MPRIRILKRETFQNTREKILINLPYWIAAGLVAVVSILYNQLFKICEEWALSNASNSILLVTAPLAVLGSFLIGHFFSKEAIGSGIPQVIAAQELAAHRNPFIDKVLSLPMLISKIAGSCLCALGGGVTGREGPTLQISAAIFYQLSKYWPKKLPKPQLPSMILAGGAAGLASAFNTPLGGVVFAIEEMAKEHISLVRTTVFQAVIIAGILAQLFLGNYLYLGAPSFGSFPTSSLYHTLLIATIVGIAGSAFAEGLFQVTSWRSKKSLTFKICFTILAGLLLSLTIYVCGPSTIGAGKTVMVDIINHADQPVSPLLFFSRFLGNFFTYIGGVIGGVFAPALSIGATLAQLINQFMGFADTKLMILVGMVAFLTGITRTPFTSFVLVLEMTDSHEIILYLMLSSIIANVVARVVSIKSFYEKAAENLIHSAPKEIATA